MRRTPTARPSTSTRRRAVARAAGVAGVFALAAGWLAFDRLWGHGVVRTLGSGVGTVTPGPVFRHPFARELRSSDDVREALGRVPPLDRRFNRIVLVAIGPRSSSGYAVRVDPVVEQRRRIVVRVHVEAPRLGDRVRAGVTYPAVLIAVQRSGGDKPIIVKGLP